MEFLTDYFKDTYMNNNPYLTTEFQEYLLAAGFQESESVKSHYDVMYYKDDRCILFKNDTMDFMIMTEEEPNERHACLSKYMSFSGFSQLDTFKWILLLHVTGYVPIQKLVQAAKTKEERMPDIIEAIINSHFKIPVLQAY